MVVSCCHGSSSVRWLFELSVVSRISRRSAIHLAFARWRFAISVLPGPSLLQDKPLLLRQLCSSLWAPRRQPYQPYWQGNAIMSATKRYSSARAFGWSTLCGSILVQRAAHSALSNLHLTAQEINASRATRRAYKFPNAASFRINLSSVRSDIARQRCSFSFCNRFRSMSCSVPIPPYFFFQQ